MNTRLCNATLRITTDYYGNTKPEIVLSYVTQIGNEIERHKRVFGGSRDDIWFDTRLDDGADISEEMYMQIMTFLDMIDDWSKK